MLGEVAKIVSETLGFGTVVINLYRPETDEYEVRAVLGSERARELLGDVSAADTWTAMLDPRFLRRGAFFVPADGVDWDKDSKCVRARAPAGDRRAVCLARR